MNSTSTAFDAGRPRRSRPIRWLTRVVEPIASPFAGTRWFPLWAILGHVGRASGKAYATPIVALQTGDGFIIPLPFGDATQWARNVFAAGGGSLRRAGHEYRFGAPQIVDREAAAQLPPIIRFLSRRLGLRQFVLVRRISD